MKQKPCDCCAGVEPLTPMPIVNRPGLAQIAYRVGTRAAFLETMKASLARLRLEDETASGEGDGSYPLQKLTTRAADDPAIALLDAWAVVADALTFYQERIANECYLRTAVERRSIQELARLVGYKLRPGLAASVYLAFTVENEQTVEIPAGTRAQSLPAPGEKAQSFETAEPLHARAVWNTIRPRLTEIQILGKDTSELYLEGSQLNLKPNDPIIITYKNDVSEEATVVRRIQEVKIDAVNQQTAITLQNDNGEPDTGCNGSEQDEKDGSAQAESFNSETLLETANSQPNLTLRQENSRAVTDIAGNKKKEANAQSGTIINTGSIPFDLTKLQPPLKQQPANVFRLRRSLGEAFTGASDFTTRLVTTMRPQLVKTLYQALANTGGGATSQQVMALRVKAAPYGAKLPDRKPIYNNANPNKVTGYASLTLADVMVVTNNNTILKLDGEYNQVVPGSRVVVEPPFTNNDLVRDVFKVNKVQTVSEPGYGTVTQLTLDGDWLSANAAMSKLRQTTIYAQSETLPLARQPVTADIEGVEIALDALYDGLDAGRWLIVTGERADIPGITGVQASELVMIAGVRQETDGNTAGDKPYTILDLAPEGLTYRYKRDTVTIYANVVKATHGETQQEILGSGNGRYARQSFTLQKSPLTHLPAATPTGAVSALAVRVNDVLWHEADDLLALTPQERGYITHIDQDDNATLIFGDGVHGARLPTGLENVTAVYRVGLGKAGNVAAAQISQLAKRPLGVKGVINPLVAAGGADRESGEQARRNAPLAVIALNRLVSVQDYADFAQAYAGIAKASAVRLTNGRWQIIHLTIAGADDIPISPESDLYRGLCHALHTYGDPRWPVQVAPRELLLLVTSLNVRLLPDHHWEAVAPQIRAALLGTFSFERRQLGQHVFLSELYSCVQQTPGVAYVDVDILGSISEKTTKNGKTDLCTPEDIADGTKKLIEDEKQPLPQIPVNLANPTNGVIRPAQLAYLTPRVSDTLILTELS